MAHFVSTKGISAEISSVISNAKKGLVIITPYVQIGSYFQEKLMGAGKRGTLIHFVCRTKDLKNEQRKFLHSIPNLFLYTHDNVHAKCYYNEFHLLIGSMNFYEYSNQNNREMGILISAQSDRQLYNDAVRECFEIIQMAQFLPKNNIVSFSNQQEKKSIRNYSRKGFCIRCHSEIIFNSHYPLCEKCYATWAFWGNIDFVEQYCHSCGTLFPTSKRKPICISCFGRN